MKKILLRIIIIFAVVSLVGFCGYKCYYNNKKIIGDKIIELTGIWYGKDITISEIAQIEKIVEQLNLMKKNYQIVPKTTNHSPDSMIYFVDENGNTQRVEFYGEYMLCDVGQFKVDNTAVSTWGHTFFDTI